MQVVGKIACHARQLQVLLDHLPIYRQAEGFIHLHQLGQVLPAARGDKLQAVRSCLHAIEVITPDFQIGQNRAVDATPVSVFLPYREVLLHVDALDAVERDDIKLAHRFVVFGRVARGDHHPARRQLLVAEGFALQKLQHHGRERFRNAVDLIEEQDALGDACALDLTVDRGDDLTHRVGRDRVFLPAKLLMFDIGQAERGLARVMGQGVGHQPHAGFLRDLLHDLRFADARRAHQQDRALPDGRDAVRTELIAREIGAQRVFDLVFGSFDMHIKPPVSTLETCVSLYSLSSHDFILTQHGANRPRRDVVGIRAALEHHKSSVILRPFFGVNPQPIGEVEQPAQMMESAFAHQPVDVLEHRPEVSRGLADQFKTRHIVSQIARVRDALVCAYLVVALDNAQVDVPEKAFAVLQ